MGVVSIQEWDKATTGAVVSIHKLDWDRGTN
jgi:hypothetical protein